MVMTRPFSIIITAVLFFTCCYCNDEDCMNFLDEQPEGLCGHYYATAVTKGLSRRLEYVEINKLADKKDTDLHRFWYEPTAGKDHRSASKFVNQMASACTAIYKGDQKRTADCINTEGGKLMEYTNQVVHSRSCEEQSTHLFYRAIHLDMGTYCILLYLAYVFFQLGRMISQRNIQWMKLLIYLSITVLLVWILFVALLSFLWASNGMFLNFCGEEHRPYWRTLNDIHETPNALDMLVCITGQPGVMICQELYEWVLPWYASWSLFGQKNKIFH
jgi:hypothetical protein